MKKIYIDVTQAYVWTGEVTGIIRVMDEISSRFAGDQEFSTVFIIWEEKAGLFRQVDYLQAINGRSKLVQSEQPSKYSIKPNSFSTKNVARKVIRGIPLTKTTYKFVTSRNSRIGKILSHKYAVRFEPNSIFFMPHGGVWESDKYIRRILELQRGENLKLVPVLYDLCPILTPQFCAPGIRRVFKKYMKQVLPKSDMVLSISNNTAKDVESWLTSLGVKNLPVTKVFRLGDEVGNQAPKKPAKSLPADFILCVGTVEARKNHASLYYAYKLAEQQGLDLPPVVVAGRKGWHTEDIYEIITNDPTTKNKFLFLHKASDNELAWLYQNALFSVYPSFYEGWGLPVAESLLRGLPCLASNSSSIPEIAGNLVDYFSPYSPQEIMLGIKKLSGNPKLLASKTKSVRHEYRATSWDMAYRQVANYITSIN